MKNDSNQFWLIKSLKFIVNKKTPHVLYQSQDKIFTKKTHKRKTLNAMKNIKTFTIDFRAKLYRSGSVKKTKNWFIKRK